jgi:hypothetical protein
MPYLSKPCSSKTSRPKAALARRRFVGLAAAACLPLVSPAARAIEEPSYTVERKLGEVEIRAYAPYVVAEVVVPGPAESAGNRAFPLLAGYIFGRNKGERKMAMTAPVTQTAAPMKMEMTAPVTQTTTEGGFVVQFVLPREVTLDRAPEPLDQRVKVREVPAARWATITFSGLWSQDNYERHLAQLREGVAAAGLQVQGDPMWSRYDAPWKPWFLRRNEIWLSLK